MSETLPPDYFESIYKADPDPWHFETSAYERDKYTATLAALPRARYRHAFEIGCSIGVLTERLAQCCDSLLAVDASAEALYRAEERCKNLPQVRFSQMHIPAEFPPDTFDLTLVSEVGYYLSRTDLSEAIEKIVAHLEPGGHLLLVHWTPVVEGYPLTGDIVHDMFLVRVGRDLRHIRGQRAESYRLDLLERV